VNMLRRRGAAVLLVAAAALAGGCATVPPGAESKDDPWQGYNRAMYSFNDSVDAAVLKPVAEGYRKVVPQLVRTGIDNFLGNIGDVWSAANQFLQGKVQQGMDMSLRVVTNTIVGLGGVLDPATEMGLVRRSEDFGQTLGRWGVGTGPYLVLPFLGPSNVRDGFGLIADRQASPSTLGSTEYARIAISAIEIVNLRANLLGTTQLVDAVALDRYSFIRQAYLARRLDQVYDGAPPAVKFEDDFEDPEPPPAKPAPKP
jgi:phospholipid-binding lipoprotein MlaA